MLSGTKTTSTVAFVFSDMFLSNLISMMCLFHFFLVLTLSIFISGHKIMSLKVHT